MFGLARVRVWLSLWRHCRRLLDALALADARNRLLVEELDRAHAELRVSRKNGSVLGDQVKALRAEVKVLLAERDHYKKALAVVEVVQGAHSAEGGGSDG